MDNNEQSPRTTGGPADKHNTNSKRTSGGLVSASSVVKDHLRRLNQLERRLLGEECYCERGICASCVALTSIREERRQLESTSARGGRA